MKNPYIYGYLPLITILLFSLTFGMYAVGKSLQIFQAIGVYSGMREFLSDFELRVFLLIVFAIVFFMLFSALKLVGETIHEVGMLFFSKDNEGATVSQARGEREAVRRLSRAATEVLAIVAYHEPVSRAEIEAIRGVQTSPGTLDTLMEAGWVRGAGRREVPGRPVIYATTPEFLDHFGLQSRRDLPGIDELKAAGLLDPVDEAFDALMPTPKEAGESDS